MNPRPTPITAVVVLAVTLASALPAATSAATGTTEASPAGVRKVAVASAVNAFEHVTAVRSTGTLIDPSKRFRLTVPDNSLDAAVLRGVRPVLARAFTGAEFVFLRMRAPDLEDLDPNSREKATIDRLVAEVAQLPQRAEWDRIVLITPAYRGFESDGLGSKLFGVGIYVQNQDTQSEYDVVEPDGTPSTIRQNRYVALFGFINITVVDARSLSVLERRRWSFNEKIHDSRVASLFIGNAIPAEVLADRFEKFIESASRRAVAATLGGTVEIGEMKEAEPR